SHPQRRRGARDQSLDARRLVAGDRGRQALAADPQNLPARRDRRGAGTDARQPTLRQDRHQRVLKLQPTGGETPDSACPSPRLALRMGIRHRFYMTDSAKRHAPILAAGGIVLRGKSRPRIAIVRLRREKAWVLPKGKLMPREHPRDAAKREVLEETGYRVSVH